MAKSRTWWGLLFTILSVLGPVLGLLYLCFPQTTFQPAIYRDPSSIITHFMRCVGCNLLFSHSVLLSLKLADNQHKLHSSICKLFTLVTIFIGTYEVIIFSKSSARFEALRELCMTAVMVAYLAKHNTLYMLRM